MLDFFTDIKNELDSKYNDATIYENREIAKRAAENYIDDVQSRLSYYAESDPLYKIDALATDTPCMSLIEDGSNMDRLHSIIRYSATRTMK